MIGGELWTPNLSPRVLIWLVYNKERVPLAKSEALEHAWRHQDQFWSNVNQMSIVSSPHSLIYNRYFGSTLVQQVQSGAIPVSRIDVRKYLHSYWVLHSHSFMFICRTWLLESWLPTTFWAKIRAIHPSTSIVGAVVPVSTNMSTRRDHTARKGGLIPILYIL